MRFATLPGKGPAGPFHAAAKDHGRAASAEAKR